MIYKGWTKQLAVIKNVMQMLVLCLNHFFSLVDNYRRELKSIFLVLVNFCKIIMSYSGKHIGYFLKQQNFLYCMQTIIDWLCHMWVYYPCNHASFLFVLQLNNLGVMTVRHKYNSMIIFWKLIYLLKSPFCKWHHRLCLQCFMGLKC